VVLEWALKVRWQENFLHARGTGKWRSTSHGQHATGAMGEGHLVYLVEIFSREIWRPFYEMVIVACAKGSIDVDTNLAEYPRRGGGVPRQTIWHGSTKQI